MLFDCWLGINICKAEDVRFVLGGARGYNVGINGVIFMFEELQMIG